jgi:hypothetical protein
MPSHKAIAEVKGASSPVLSETSPETTCPPLFIVGPSRSGTTLFAKMLDAHSALAIFPETWCYVELDLLGCLQEFTDQWQYVLFLNRMWKHLHEENDPAARIVAEEGAKRPRYVGPTAPILESIGQAYAKARHARVWGEKTPSHILWLHEIRRLFPNARILVIIRDPRDVLLSYDERWGGGRRDADFIMRAAAQVRHNLSHFVKLRGFPREQIFTIKYEDLVAEPARVLHSVCQFLKLEFEPEMLHFYRKNANGRITGEYHELLNQPARTERIARYRACFSSPQIALIQNFLAEEMNILGYPIEPQTACILGKKELRAYENGIQLFHKMTSGEIRRQYRKNARAKLAACRWVGALLLTRLSRPAFAVKSEQWQQRAAIPS